MLVVVANRLKGKKDKDKRAAAAKKDAKKKDVKGNQRQLLTGRHRRDHSARPDSAELNSTGQLNDHNASGEHVQNFTTDRRLAICCQAQWCSVEFLE